MNLIDRVRRGGVQKAAAVLLLIGLAGLGAGYLTAGLPGAAADPLRLSAPEAFERTRAGELLLIDVRTREEWQRTGVPAGAVPITIHQDRRSFYEAVMKAVDGDTSRPVGLICAAGVRSHRASDILSTAGFDHLFDVSEGMEGSAAGPGWRRRGLPLAEPPRGGS